MAAGVLVVSSLNALRTAAAQSPPPVQGTIALEGAMKKVYRGANVVIVTTIDGVEHAYRFARDLVVHGGNGTDVSALEGLREGSTVVVHYSIQGAEQSAREIDVIGAEGLEATEATVTRIDLGEDHGALCQRDDWCVQIDGARNSGSGLSGAGRDHVRA